MAEPQTSSNLGGIKTSLKLEDFKAAEDIQVERTTYETAKAIKAFSLTDAPQDYTRKLKRNVMTWSAAAVLINLYHLRITDVPWLQIKLPDSALDITAFLIFVPLLYSLVSFTVQALADLSAWRTRHDENLFRTQFNTVHRLAEYVRLINDENYVRTSILISDHQRIQAKVLQSVQASEAASAALIAALRNARAGTRLRMFLAYLWEFSLPLVVAIAAVLYSAPSALTAFIDLLSQP